MCYKLDLKKYIIAALAHYIVSEVARLHRTPLLTSVFCKAYLMTRFMVKTRPESHVAA
jgi:hypothetical protein